MTLGPPLGTIPDEFGLADIGSTLLEELAKGLYQPEEVVREYVQNAIDAHRQAVAIGDTPTGAVQIEFRGNSLVFYDYGIGMDEFTIRKVKSIAISRKRDAGLPLTGHKGVGVWAGLSYFNTLTLVTTRKGNKNAYELVIHFDKIVEAISDTRHIGEVLNPNYQIRYYAAEKDEHYTTVTLTGPRDTHREFFLDPEAIRKAVRRICPCEVDKTFVFKNELTRWQQLHGFETHTIKVEGKPVYRGYPSNVEGFRNGEISVNDRVVARYWLAISKGNRSLTPDENQLIGIRISQNGFVVGKDNLYSDRTLSGFDELKLQSYLNWHIGEIHVISPELRPNLRRNEFEESEYRRQFIQRLRAWYQAEIEHNARVTSEIRTTHEIYDRYGAFIEAIGTTVLPSSLQESQVSALREARTTLEEHRTLGSTRGKKAANYKMTALRDPQLRTRRDRLLKSIHDLLELPTSSPSLPSTPEQGEQTQDGGDNGNDRTGRDSQVRAPRQNNVTTENSSPDASTSTTVISVTLNPGEEDPRAVDLDVILSLFDEVVQEVLGDDLGKAARITALVQERILMLTTDAI